MEIDEKYVRLLGKYIYNKRLDKYGYISSIEIKLSIGGYLIELKAYYDYFDDDDILFFEDFEKGKVQFTIISFGVPKEISDREVEDIKFVFCEKFREDMLMYIPDDERTGRIRKHEKRNTQMLFNDLTPLDRISAEVMYKDFYSRELYLKFKNGAISKEELLYALVNHLCAEYKRVDERNLEYFMKYEFPKELEEESKCEL